MAKRPICCRWHFEKIYAFAESFGGFSVIRKIFRHFSATTVINISRLKCIYTTADEIVSQRFVDIYTNVVSYLVSSLCR